MMIGFFVHVDSRAIYTEAGLHTCSLRMRMINDPHILMNRDKYKFLFKYADLTLTADLVAKRLTVKKIFFLTILPF